MTVVFPDLDDVKQPNDSQIRNAADAALRATAKALPGAAGIGTRV